MPDALTDMYRCRIGGKIYSHSEALTDPYICKRGIIAEC